MVCRILSRVWVCQGFLHELCSKNWGTEKAIKKIRKEEAKAKMSFGPRWGIAGSKNEAALEKKQEKVKNFKRDYTEKEKENRSRLKKQKGRTIIEVALNTTSTNEEKTLICQSKEAGCYDLSPIHIEYSGERKCPLISDNQKQWLLRFMCCGTNVASLGHYKAKRQEPLAAECKHQALFIWPMFEEMHGSGPVLYFIPMLRNE